MNMQTQAYAGELAELRKLKRAVLDGDLIALAKYMRENDTRLAERSCTESSQLGQSGSTPEAGSNQKPWSADDAFAAEGHYDG